jgi:lipopolysaccharide biosynthesis regulator YciM
MFFHNVRLTKLFTIPKRFEKAEDIYLRLFRASLTSPQHKDILHKTFALIVNFYDKNGFPDRAINVHQDLLAVYQRVLGPTQESTIKVLYELGMKYLFTFEVKIVADWQQE